MWISVCVTARDLFTDLSRARKQDVLTAAAPALRISVSVGLLVSSTGLIHACEGVIKSFRSVSVCNSNSQVLFRSGSRHEETAPGHQRMPYSRDDAEVRGTE